MKRWKRLFYYLLINIFVSACTVWLILSFWERSYRASIETVAPAPLTLAISSTPPSIPIPAASPQPTVQLDVYRVQPGDTLGDIALQFDMSVEDLMAINGLTDPNLLGVGDVLVIPITPGPDQGPSSPTLTQQAALTESSPPAAMQTPSPSGLNPVIEIVSVVGAGVLEDERVVLKLDSDGPLDLENWQLQDEDGHVYVFPKLTLFQGGAVSVYTRPGNDTVVELHWGVVEPIWAEGEKVTLRDPAGSVQATSLVP